jgi:hypothetical protein
MPALDFCHENVVHALEKDGWTITDTVRVVTATRTIFIDIEARRDSNGSRQQILLAEIKCFPDRDSTTREIYTAIGQYIIYRTALAQQNLHFPLYLAVPESVYHNVFDPIVHQAILDNRMKIVVVNIDTETIVQWIE